MEIDYISVYATNKNAGHAKSTAPLPFTKNAHGLSKTAAFTVFPKFKILEHLDYY